MGRGGSGFGIRFTKVYTPAALGRSSHGESAPTGSAAPRPPTDSAHAKKELLGLINDYFAEARERRHELVKRPDYVRDVLREGGLKGRSMAQEYMARARERVGLITTY